MLVPSSIRVALAKYRKWSAARGMSAASVSRTGLPLSHVSLTASISRFASMASAIPFRALALSVRDVSPHSALLAWAASSASSTSSGVERATSQNGWPVAGARLTMYSPLTGATQ